MYIPTFILCPNCGVPMKRSKTTRRYTYYVTDEDEEDEYGDTKCGTYDVISDVCHRCQIQRLESTGYVNEGIKWIVSNPEMQITSRQLETIKFIRSQVSVDISVDNLVTKSQATEFISKYLQEAIDNYNKESDGDRDIDYLVDFDDIPF